jgi:hypothetical protein
MLTEEENAAMERLQRLQSGESLDAAASRSRKAVGDGYL